MDLFHFLTLFLVVLGNKVEAEHRPRGIFIQVNSSYTWVLPHLTRWLDNICAKNRQLPANQRMDDLVLQDIATENITGTQDYTMRFDVLDRIAPYFPGGPKSCFGNLFVGTIEVNWTGGGELYFDGIKNTVFRQRNIDLSRAVGTEFKQHFPNTNFNWYVTYESNLNYLTDTDCLAGYEDYLTRLVKTLTTIQPASVMWSPAFWDTWETTVAKNSTRLRLHLSKLFSNVQARSPPGINWMNLQDSLGKASPCTKLQTTQPDAIKLFQFLRDSFPFKSMQMNEELFKYNENCDLVETSAETQIQREDAYLKAGVPLGAAFEIRFWREREQTVSAFPLLPIIG